MRATIRDVAKLAGVSVATTSMALNNREGVNKLTREKVLKAARELNYMPNYSARSLVTQDSSCIGLLIPEIQNPFYSAIVDIMTRIAEERGFNLLLGITNNSSRQEAEYTRMFISRRVRGVIVIPTLSRDPDIRHLDILRAADIPIVFCTERYAGCDEALVMCDFEAGEYAATKHLIERGLKDFWFVSVDMDAHFTRLRYEGYRRAMREAGLECRSERELMVEGPHYHYAYEATDRIIDDLPEAVICINDIMTMAIVKRMVERGLRVPRDVSVVGFDDIMFSELVSPPLTTVRQPLQEICEKTMRILESKLTTMGDHMQVEKGRVHLIQPELIVRDSAI